MISKLRLRLLRALLLVWACSLIAEASNFTFLGYEIGVTTRGVFPGAVLLLGLCSIIIFVGPTRLEMMEQLRHRKGNRTCGLDLLYMHFTLDRGFRSIIALLLLFCVELFVHRAAARFIGGVVAITLSVAFLTGLRIFVVRKRVLAGVFGTTEYELRELLNFLKRLYASPESQGSPPGGLPEYAETADALTIPSNIEVAL